MIRILAILSIFAAVVVIIGAVIQKNDTMFINSSDNINIAADLYEVEQPKGWLLLVHMMPATKESWRQFAAVMQEAGYESLAIDLRGHGESVYADSRGQMRRLDYREFSDEEHQASIKDLEAGWEFLKSRGALLEKTTLIGASIGANLSLQFLANHQDFNGGVLLSAGNYKGIDSAVLVKKLNPNQKIILVASKMDESASDNNAEQNQQYYAAASQLKNRHLIVYDGGGHGTDFLNLRELQEEYDLTVAIKKFLEYGLIN